MQLRGTELTQNCQHRRDCEDPGQSPPADQDGEGVGKHQAQALGDVHGVTQRAPETLARDLRDVN